jgi:hypothetical protein
MANGIASADLVIAIGKAKLLASYGAAGQVPEKIITISNAGTENQKIFYDTPDNLANQKIQMPFCLIIPGELNHMETEAIEELKKCAGTQFDPKIAEIFIKSLTKKIKALESFISYNISSNSSEKIAKFLYDNESILINLKQVKIAQILNITPETFSRKVSKLKKDKIIQNEQGYITILDHERLKYLING